VIPAQHVALSPATLAALAVQIDKKYVEMVAEID